MSAVVSAEQLNIVQHIQQFVKAVVALKHALKQNVQVVVEEHIQELAHLLIQLVIILMIFFAPIVQPTKRVITKKWRLRIYFPKARVRGEKLGFKEEFRLSGMTGESRTLRKRMKA